MKAICAIGMAALILTVGPTAMAADPYPYDVDSAREVTLIGAAAATVAVGLLWDNSARRLTPDELAGLDRADVNAFDRGATGRWSPGADKASDYLVYATIAAPVGLIASSPGNERAGRLALIYAETMALNMGTTFALKGIFARPRPYLYNDDPRIPAELRTSHGARRSFPSGHTANAFSSMVFFATVFERLQPDSSARGWVWGGCLTAATTTGVLRYLAGRHYPTDILAGAALGAVTGWLLPKLHEVGEAGVGTGAGLKVAWGFGF
jgi:membrane-associated phospholipid phosphatase